MSPLPTTRFRDPVDVPRQEERRSGIVRRRGGFISVPQELSSARLNVEPNRRMTRLLLNVTIGGSLGPVQVVLSAENSVGDLVRAALGIYTKEKRRPLLAESDPKRFELHYSQYSLESLEAKEKLMNLGSRNFFLCRKPSPANKPYCSEEAKKVTGSPFLLTNLMDFLL